MGFSLGEIVLLLLVGIIVVGPRNLPPMMRTAGLWIARIRRMSVDLRSQSGIDDLIRQEGLENHLHELRSLSSLSRLNMVESLIAPAAAGAPLKPSPAMGSTPRERAQAAMSVVPDQPLREREYPLIGCDAGGALADDMAPYAEPRVEAPATPDDVLELLPPSPAPEAPSA